MRATNNRDFHPVPILGGDHCPKCGNVMQRYTHNPKWKPLPGRGFYKHWDRCIDCRRYYNPADAYVKGSKDE
jgi:uncharacterized protein with PIN domain